jgi:hypothetical protein
MTSRFWRRAAAETVLAIGFMLTAEWIAQIIYWSYRLVERVMG